MATSRQPSRVGLTGGIGSGKSTVGQMLAALGAVLIDADQISRDVTGPGAHVEVQPIVGIWSLSEGAPIRHCRHSWTPLEWMRRSELALRSGGHQAGRRGATPVHLRHVGEWGTPKTRSADG